MAKRLEQDGKFFRFRRGKLVEIPMEWVGNTTHAQTIRKRPSKLTHKRRLAEKSSNKVKLSKSNCGKILNEAIGPLL